MNKKLINTPAGETVNQATPLTDADLKNVTGGMVNRRKPANVPEIEPALEEEIENYKRGVLQDIEEH